MFGNFYGSHGLYILLIFGYNSPSLNETLIQIGGSHVCQEDRGNCHLQG